MNAPAPEGAFGRAVLEGLTAQPKKLSPKWLYDEQGAALFEAITDLEEYYPTRTEIALLKQSAPELVAGIGPDAVVIEFGAGSSLKTPILLEALDQPSLYAPIDIQQAYLDHSSAAIRARFPNLAVHPVLGDFTRLEALPLDFPQLDGPRVGFFPGSTIGNLDAGPMQTFLRASHALLGEGAILLVGVDTPKPLDVLIPAYDDAKDVTAEFNLNLLRRINSELGANFDIGAFRHEARWNERDSRVEMHLVSVKEQTVGVLGVEISFAAGESIHTESSHKMAPEVFVQRAEAADWSPDGLWLAPGGMFSIHRLKAR